MIYHLTIRLTEDDVREDSKIPLTFVKFQNVQNLTVSVGILVLLDLVHSI